MFRVRAKRGSTAVSAVAGRIRPGRYLVFFMLIVALLYTLVFATGDHRASPKLGIDLQGGTRVVLTARTETGATPSREALGQARAIIESRVNGIGVGGTEVVLDGSQIVITVPGEGGEQAKTLGQTARLYFREVIGAPMPVPASGAQPEAEAACAAYQEAKRTPGVETAALISKAKACRQNPALVQDQGVRLAA